MKRLFVLLLAVLMLFSAVACKEETKPASETETEETEGEESATAEQKVTTDKTPAVGDDSQTETKPKEGLVGTWVLYVDMGAEYRNLEEGTLSWKMYKTLDPDQMKIRGIDLVLNEDGTYTFKGNEERIREDAVENYAKPMIAAQEAYGQEYGTGKPLTELMGKTYDELVEQKAKMILSSLYGGRINFSGTWEKEGAVLKLLTYNRVIAELQLNEEGTAVLSYQYVNTTFLAEKVA